VAAELIPDIDIWRSANEPIKQYDDLADVEAAARADELEELGDRRRTARVLPILKAIDALRKVQPKEKAQ
jgi:hypothetical protein